MQLLLDTDAMSDSELGLAINLLDDILAARRKTSDTTDKAVENSTLPPVMFGASRGMDTAPPVPATAPLPPAAVPAPPAVMLTTDENGDDIEVETDETGNVTALTTSVQLPAAAPPPPAPPAPVAAGAVAGIPAATPLPPGPAVAPELDSRGYPWDGRIHASNRSQTIKHEWKLKRGVDKNLVVACEAQNKPGNAPSPATAPTVVAAATTAVPVPTAPTAPAPPAPAAPSTATPSVPPSTGSAAPIDFRGLMQKIQQAQAAKKLSDAQVNAALLTVGLQPQDMAQLIGNALYIASVNAAIDGYLA